MSDRLRLREDLHNSSLRSINTIRYESSVQKQCPAVVGYVIEDSLRGIQS